MKRVMNSCLGQRVLLWFHFQKKKWAIEEIEELRELFNEDITNDTVSMKQVAARLEHLSVNATQQQVYDKLKNLLSFTEKCAKICPSARTCFDTSK